MAKPEHNPAAAGKATAVMFGAWTVLLWVLGNFGFYSGMATMLEKCHLFFNLTALGLVLGTAESLVYGFAAGYVFVWLYNKM